MAKPGKPKGGKGRRPSRRYFVPDEICLLSEHPPNLAGSDELKDRTIKQLNSVDKDLRLDYEAIDLFPYSIGDDNLNTPVVVTLPKGFTDQRLTRLIKEMRVGEDGLVAASPNWFFGSSQDNITTGGPGGWPVEETIGTGWNAPYFKLDGTQLVDKILHPYRATTNTQNSEDCAVDVVIFDTIPPIDAIRAALRKYPKQTTLADLVDSGRFHIAYAKPNGITLLENDKYVVKRHIYPMTSHGLFVAGLIHNIAPKANIYLIEVLNQYGIGTQTALIQSLFKLVSGLKVVQNIGTEEKKEAKTKEIRLSAQHLILNYSLCVGFHRKELRFGLTAKLGLAAANDSMNLLATVMRGVTDAKPIINRISEVKPRAVKRGSLAAKHVRIFGAAGNDSANAQTQKEARYPALFNFVYGVGALNADGSKAIYSNIPDDPLGQGYYIFGGKAATVDAPDLEPLDGDLSKVEVTDGNGGVVGIFIDRFPDPNKQPESQSHRYKPKTVPNKTGWARWSGTSFATPILVGLFAELTRQTCSFNIAATYVEQFRATSDDVDNLIVDQHESS